VAKPAAANNKSLRRLLQTLVRQQAPPICGSGYRNTVSSGQHVQWTSRNHDDVGNQRKQRKTQKEPKDPRSTSWLLAWS
jgi:hypothetical protein